MAILQQTIGEVVRERATLHPDTEAYVYPEHGIRKTYKEFDEERDQLAKFFMGMKIEKVNILRFGLTINANGY